ncbi:hypothetical protein MoryE10_20060 [Methylogaea oryzae]|uniref:SGNH/GDSL hydrolase family protein n=2 Tax=Methylogaea oryzae TaxID=1295382 RepID=A0A8D5AMT3_9GAMM|nr:hypothetical protein MoryE10_20060 [Methylogaea oryzae]
MSIKPKSLLGEIGGYAFALIISIALLEFSVAFVLNHSDLLRFKRDNLLRNYYMKHDRSIIQFQPDCARYDPGLGYTLKPGVCRFSNREFDTEYRVNSLGMRDDEESLATPEVIVLGDSYAMGWGVEQNETFAEIIAAQTGMKVLNTAVSSYGTVRELKALSRISLERAKFLIIQYCRNDYEENLAYLKNGNTLPVMSEAEYSKIAAKLNHKTKYYFGKHSAYLLKSLAKQVKYLVKPSRGGKTPPPFREDETSLFINALLHSPANLGELTVIVVELNSQSDNDGRFVAALNQRLATKDQPLLDRVQALDLSPSLKPDDFFVLDDHLNARGHRVVAERLIEAMGKSRKHLDR